jgi:hypothetical protein
MGKDGLFYPTAHNAYHDNRNSAAYISGKENV